MKIKQLTLIAAISFAVVSCGGANTEEPASTENNETEVVETTPEEVEEVSPMDNKGVGPISNVELGEIDEALAEKGKEVYKTNCTACHKIGKRSVGPALQGVTERRSPEWVMNMIMNPEGMVAEDPIAKALLEEYLAPMANQSISEEDARAILEFLRTKN